MIIRILGEGQYDVSDDALDTLNELDAAVEAAVTAQDEREFRRSLSALLDAVRTQGTQHSADSLDASDLILPMGDATLGEVADLLQDDGLIPG